MRVSLRGGNETTRNRTQRVSRPISWAIIYLTDGPGGSVAFSGLSPLSSRSASLTARIRAFATIPGVAPA